MTTIWARQALLPDGWAQDVTVRIGADGRVTSAEAGTSADGHRVGLLLPAPVNVHSHAFQRAMAGLTEDRGPSGSDSFWTWRRRMYQFLDRLTPEHIESIAAFVQMEMLEAGFGASVEFHYLHQQPDGQPYDDIAEMSGRIAAAAERSGIGLTLLPVHYQFGGCDGRPLGPGQVRFGTDPDSYARLVVGAERAIAGLPDATLGLAPHSLRAVAPDALRDLARLAGTRPLHMHLAEQNAEVEEVQAALGGRPVEWMLGQGLTGPKWCFIHCTQMLEHETNGLAASGSVAGLCPITEANLGDGTFDGVRWLNAGGAIAVGSDSNVRISLAEELRSLEYSQRLRDRSRAALAGADRSTGRALFDAVIAGGAQAAGRQTGAIAEGHLADLLALDDTHPDLIARSPDQCLDSFVVAGAGGMITDVWSGGRHRVRQGRHVMHDEIAKAYKAVLADLQGTL